MSPRRSIRVYGPAIGLGALLVAMGCACVPWSFEGSNVARFASRGLSENYGIALGAKGGVTITLLPLPRLTFEDVRLSAGTEDGPVLSEGGSLAIQLSPGSLLWGKVEVVSLALDGAKVMLADSSEDLRWAAPVQRLASHLASEDIARPRRITLSRIAMPARGASDIDAVIAWPLWSDRLHSVGKLTWSGVTARFALTDLHPRDLAGSGTTPFSVSVMWDGGSINAEGSGSTRDGLKLAGQGSFTTRSLPETLAWVGSGMPLTPLVENIALDGHFEATADTIRLPSMRVQTGSTVLEGAGSIELTGRRPSLRATLATDSLNLGPLLAGGLRVAGLDGSSEGWGRSPLALAPLVGGDLDLRLSATSARLGPVLVEDLASSVIVRETGIDVAIGKASVQGGSLKGRVTLAAARGRADETEIKAQGAFDRVDLAALLLDLGQYGWLLGSTQGAFVLEGAGRDADSLLKRTSGRASFVADGGAIAGLDLTDVIHRGGTVAQNPLSWRNGRTPFERASVSLSFSDGVGEITEGSLAARALTATLRGRLSLPDRSFEARAELLPRTASADGTLGAPSATLFEIAGPWDAVTVRAQPREGRSGDPLKVPTAAGSALPTRVRAFAP